MTRALVVTTIFEPTEALAAIARDHSRWLLVVVGDRKTPANWALANACYLSLTDQEKCAGEFARELPVDHYSRKNIGYLHAIRAGANVIAETDDDNFPTSSFLRNVKRTVHAPSLRREGWQNVYLHFTDVAIWPRGFPLDAITTSLRTPPQLDPPSTFDCPIQQYLADGDPDVDAIFRLTTEDEIRFRDGTVVLPPGSFCPFNSQNTIWWPEAFSLLYLPSYVSLRLADIWRSLVAQVCLHMIDRQIAFHGPTVHHMRHTHSLMKDFEEEIPGYLNNDRILKILGALPLSRSTRDTPANLRQCYETLIAEGFLPPDELELLDLWLAELEVPAA